MRRLIAISILVLALGLGPLSYADTLTTAKSIAATLTVDSLFGFTIWDAEYNLGGPTAVFPPGGSGSAPIHIFATSNHSIPWMINASSAGLIGQNQAVPDTIPILISTFPTTNPLGGATVTNMTLTAVSQSIYTATASEVPVSNFEVGCMVTANIPLLALQDFYTGTLVLTMNE